MGVFLPTHRMSPTRASIHDLSSLTPLKSIDKKYQQQKNYTNPVFPIGFSAHADFDGILRAYIEDGLNHPEEP
jgi:hypothetical protein